MLTVFGSINLDLVFRVRNMPRPGETLMATSYAEFPGGKGANQAAAAAKAGATVRFCCGVGADDAGRSLLAGLDSVGVDVTDAQTVDAPTGRALIAVDAAGENCIVVASGANNLVRAASVADAALSEGGCLLLQNEVPDAENAALAARAKRRGMTVVLNTAPWRTLSSQLLAAVDVLVLNETELAGLAEEVLGEAAAETAVPEIVAELAASHGLRCVVTLGAKGALVAGDKNSVINIAALAIEPVDTTGAGDAFSGVLAARLAIGATLEEALKYASVAGSLACTALGAQAAQPTLAAILHVLPELTSLQHERVEKRFPIT